MNIQRQLLLSFYGTQLFLLVITIGILWFQGRLSVGLLGWDHPINWVLGVGAGFIIVCVDLLLTRWLPKEMLDDGGINELLFANQNVIQIFMIALTAGVVEELLFRGAIQEWLGIWGTSLLFVVIHTRYLRKWVMVLVVGLISVGFGYLYVWTGSLISVMVAHTLVDFIMGCYIRYVRED
ncbi:CPBP family intramembrane glutamic endopeptidase [Hazenella coriacea]|uniref:CAAX prenyl protease 2/Lysostaphin resistance protein A-like domain-containing protein n=1 Tax=Hazenella coriacea TaxID=1179467 RepID=A0A4V2UUW4_9BACL|nr:type II CAAX endopeptidase family protein [Hazenella coriacea]TCS93427.1 hypothetical protein EDD58_10774 [Hazenella coriacea]